MEFSALEPIGSSFDESGCSENESCDSLSIADESGETLQLMKALVNQTGNDTTVGACQADTDRLSVYEFRDDASETGDLNTEVTVDTAERTSECCDNLCNLRIWSHEVRQRLQMVIENRSKSEIKQTLLDHLHNQGNLGASTCGFLFGGNYFCRRGFAEVSGVSDYLVREVFKAFFLGQVTFVHGNGIGFREKQSTISFTAWMQTFSHNFGNYSPDEELIVLSSCFSLKDLYYIYCSEAPAPHITKSYFYKLFREKFGPKRLDKSLPRLRVSKYSKHSKCDNCLSLDRYQKGCRGENELEFAKSLKQSHRMDFVKARLTIEGHRQKALTDPESCLMIQVDDMDNTVRVIMYIYNQRLGQFLLLQDKTFQIVLDMLLV